MYCFSHDDVFPQCSHDCKTTVTDGDDYSGGVGIVDLGLGEFNRSV